MRNQPQIAAIFQARQRQQALLQGGQRLTRYRWFMLTQRVSQRNEATRRAKGDTRVVARGLS
jgi:hypothetical protein